MEVIIPALNEEKTIYNVVNTFMQHDRITQVIVIVDDMTNDNTQSEAMLAGAISMRFAGVTGKGQLIQRAASTMLDLERVILSDADYIRINKHVVEMVTATQVTGMRIIVPRFPGVARWNASGFPKPFDATAWAVNSGFRSVPMSLIMGQELHGYLTETQLNMEAQKQHIPIEFIQVDSLIAPLRFTDRRLEAMEEDRQWGISNGLFQVSNYSPTAETDTGKRQDIPQKEDHAPQQSHSRQTGN